MFEDKTPFFYLAFECDWLFALYQSSIKKFKQLVTRIKKSGFNTIVTNLYAHQGFSDSRRTTDVFAPPKYFLYQGTNAKPNFARFNLKFFHYFDQMLSYLWQHDLIVHLMLQVQNKKVNWPARNSKEDRLFWQYVVARYQGFSNIIWDISKESYNLYRETGSHDYVLERIDLIRSVDKFKHLVTAHDPEPDSVSQISIVDKKVDFIADQIHLGEVKAYNYEAISKWRLIEKPYVNIEYGYEYGVEPIKTYIGPTTACWKEILKWTYAIILGGGYCCYYYSNTSWDLIKFIPEPPGWSRYRYLKDFWQEIDFNSLVPANELVKEGFCLANYGKEYLIFLPEEVKKLEVNLAALGEGSLIFCHWMDIFKGEKRTVITRRFAQSGLFQQLNSPLAESNPCIVHLRKN